MRSSFPIHPFSRGGLQLFIETDSDFAAFAGGHEGVGVGDLAEREAMRNDVGRVQAPAYKALGQFLHQPGGRDPRAVNRLLVVNEVGRRIELHGSALADEDDAAPLARCSNGGGACRGIGGTFDGALDTESAGEVHYLGYVVSARRQRFIAKAHVFRQLQPLLDNINADDFLSAEFARDGSGRESHGAEAGDQHGMIAADSDLLDSLVYRAESAGHLRTVGVGELVRQCDEVLLFGQHVLCHGSIALPAVGATILFAGAGDHVAAPAVVAYAASGDVVHDDAVTDVETPAAGAGFHNLPTGLVSRDHTLISLGAFPEMFVINGANIRAANGGSLDAEQNLAMTRHRHWHGSKFDGTVSRKVGCLHRPLHDSDLPEFNFDDG